MFELRKEAQGIEIQHQNFCNFQLNNTLKDLCISPGHVYVHRNSCKLGKIEKWYFKIIQHHLHYKVMKGKKTLTSRINHCYMTFTGTCNQSFVNLVVGYLLQIQSYLKRTHFSLFQCGTYKYSCSIRQGKNTDTLF